MCIFRHGFHLIWRSSHAFYHPLFAFDQLIDRLVLIYSIFNRPFLPGKSRVINQQLIIIVIIQRYKIRFDIFLLLNPFLDLKKYSFFPVFSDSMPVMNFFHVTPKH